MGYKTASGNQAFNISQRRFEKHQSYKTASGNQAFNISQRRFEKHQSYKTASGNQAFNPVARTRLTERAKSPTMENRNAVYSKNSKYAHSRGTFPPLQNAACAWRKACRALANDLPAVINSS